MPPQVNGAIKALRSKALMGLWNDCRPATQR